jgi:hypothetical protein
MKKISLFTILMALVFNACNSNADKTTSPQNADTANIVQSAALPVISDSSKLVVVNRKQEKLSYEAYKKTFEPESPSMQPAFLAKDIDADGNKEIIVNYYTGGAHCCEVTAILSRTGAREMLEVLNFTGGTVISGDTVSLNFYEALGYFHTCYACGLEAPQAVSPTADLLYKNGKFSFLPANAQTNKAIIANLDFIKARGIPNKDTPGDEGFDDGTRKETAINLTAWYFNNGRKISEVKKLFDEYYTHADKEKIWKDLASYLGNFDEDISNGVLLR